MVEYFFLENELYSSDDDESYVPDSEDCSSSDSVVYEEIEESVKCKLHCTCWNSSFDYHGHSIVSKS